MKRSHYRYSLHGGLRTYPTRWWLTVKKVNRTLLLIGAAGVLFVCSLLNVSNDLKPVGDYTSVPGQNYEICNETAQYLTSPYTYNAVAANTQQSYDVSDYEALPGYGTTLPSLPAYIANEDPTTTAAVIFGPGANVSQPAYNFPNSPIIYFFEGGSYGPIGFDSVSGDEFIGGTASGFPEPVFENAGGAGGIDGQNGSYDFSGGQGELASTANVGDTTITTTQPIGGFTQYVDFDDGTEYQIASANGDVYTLQSPLTQSESAGTDVVATRSLPIARVASAASQGATTVTLTASSIPIMQWANAQIGGDTDLVQSVSGSQSGYTLTIARGLDVGVAAGTPVYYSGLAGDVTVDYLNIDDDQHVTTGTIYTGTGWTIEDNDIHDGNSNGPGYGVALYGGDEGTIEYNCISKMGDYGINAFGTNSNFNYNEVYESNYQQDPGCGCSGGGKWWGTLNANIEDNAFINDGPGGGGPVWLDNGNTGTLISGNFFDMSFGDAVESETGFNLDITNNLFLDNDWVNGSGSGNTNQTGAVDINTSGGTFVPNSRYENELLVNSNQFVDNWGGVSIWQAGSRSCENSGESNTPWNDAAYCSGGFPNSADPQADGQYYFSHQSDNIHGFVKNVEQDAASNTSTVLVSGSEAINDQIDFVSAAATTTANTSAVTTFNGSGSLAVASTAGFPSSGQLLVDTSLGQAVLGYTGTDATDFTGVSFINDPQVANSGTLTGNVQINDPLISTTTDTTDVSTFTGAGGTINASTVNFPNSGEIRVGTSTAWDVGGGSYTGAILSYSSTDASHFYGVKLISGTGELGNNGNTNTATLIQAIQPYKVQSETCFTNDCAVTVTPRLAMNITDGEQITNAGTCQLYADSSATPTSPMDGETPNISYWDGCQWEARGIAVNGNTFITQPSVMDATPPLNGGTTSCTTADYCGSNFMSYQGGGEPPYGDQTAANAMMSSTTFSGCPAWDANCQSDPLNNLNALSNAPNAVPNNGEAPYNNVWYGNSYSGPWTFNMFIYGNCYGAFPTDPVTNNAMPTTDCNPAFSAWQSDWQQDQGSTSSANPPPTIPTGVVATASSPTSVNVNWAASSDPESPTYNLAGYYILRNGVQVGSVGPSTTTYTDNSASASTQYSYTVQSYDSAATPDVSGWSSPSQVATPSASPGVSITTISNGQFVHGNSQAVDATITPTGGNTISQSQMLIGSTVLNTLYAAPYNYSFDPLNYHNGTYNVTVNGTDNQNDTGSATDSVVINNGDLKGLGVVNISDLAIMAAHWGQADSNYSDGNITGQSTINLSDLAVLAANWGWSG